MKRAVILTQDEYDEIESILQHMRDILRSMRNTKNTRHLEHHIDDVYAVLNGEDKDIEDIKRRILHLECVAPY